VQIAKVVTFGTVTHAELEPEIDTQPDKEHKECYRDQVQRADQEEAPRSSNRQTNHKADGDGQDDLQRAQREPQDDRYPQE
jgi:hypothetical protein